VLARGADGVELGGGYARREAAPLQLAAGNDKRVLHQQLVDGRRLAQVALAGSGAFLPPAWARAPQSGRVATQRRQSQLGRLDLPPERDPGQRLTRLPEHVVRERPIALPRLRRQRLAQAGEVVELTPLLRFADLLLDRAFPLGEFFRRTARRGRRQVFRTNQPTSAWIASASTSMSRLSCASVLISGGAMKMLLFNRRGSTPF